MLATNASAYDFAVKNADGVMIYYGFYYKDTEKKEVYVTFKDEGNSYSGSVTIPKEVTYNKKTRKVTCIIEEAFRGCKNLKSVTIPNSVERILYHSFDGCSSLTSVKIPNSVTEICDYAFLNCSSLKSTTIPNSVKIIGAKAFSGCESMTSATIGNSVTSIGREAFEGCSSLTSITIPKSVTEIGATILRYCPSLQSIKVEQGNKKYDSRNNCNAIIETKSNTLLSGCMNTVIPNNVTSIEKYAFQGMTSLKKSLFLTA